MADLTGQILAERYHIQSFLGRGGMAEVYRAWDARRMTFLALKVLHEDLALDRVFLRRFQREAETLAKLQHPHIVRFYGLEQQGRLQFMLMDFIEGQTLRERIFDANGPLPLEEVHKIFSALCSALQYAHSEGMVHCDIKPANIMLHNNGTVLLADFGISRMMESSTTTSLGLSGSGTPAYMSPEQGLGQTPTGQTDIYALGIVLFEMLTGGERPFTGEHAQISGSTVEKVRWEQINAPPPSPRLYSPYISSEMEAIVLKCLEKDPARRFSSAFELWATLDRAIHGGAGNGTVASLPTVIQPPVLTTPTKIEALSQKTTVLEMDSHPNVAARPPVTASPTLHSATPHRSLNWLWGLLVLAPVALGIWYIGQQRQSQATQEVHTIVVTATNQAVAAVAQNQPAATLAPTATEPLPPSSTPTVASTPTFTTTPSPTETATPTATDTPRPRAMVQSSSNCRKGPATFYSIVYSPQAGETATIQGANRERNWLWVNFGGSECWIAMSVIDVQGDTSHLPVFTPPPTPKPTQTPIPTNTPVMALADLSCYGGFPGQNGFITVDNDSNVATGSFTLKVYHEGLIPDEGNNREFRVSGVGAYGKVNVSVTTTFSGSGTTRTYCQVDVYNEVLEYKEDNNVYYWAGGT